jgi:general secretion pathway protein L
MDIVIIQLKTNELIIASFRPKGGGVDFLRAERHQLAGEEGELTRILQGAAATFGEQRVVLALPAALLFMREMELPITDRAKVRELLPLELKGETALDTDCLVFDALPLANGKVLAVWGQSQELTERIEILKGAGFEPEVVTSSLFHWDNLAPATGVVAVTDGEALAAYSNSAPIYFRALPAGGGDAELKRTVAALELAQGVHIEQVLSYAKEGDDSGSPAHPVGGLAEAFGDDPHAARDLAGAYAVAAAVARGRVLNLRRGALAYTAGNAKLYQRLRISMLLAALFVLLLFVESGVRYYLVKRDLASLELSIKGIYKEVFPTRSKAVDEVSELRAEIKKLESAKTSSNVLKLLKDLAMIKGDDVGGIYETEVDGPEVRLKGDARSFQAVNDFKVRASKILDQAEVSEIKSRPDGSVTFNFRGKMKGVVR